MDVVESNETFSKKPTVDDAEANTLLPCCKHTIDQHAAFNAMMVCSECKQIIKCFSDEKAYTNYQRFCASGTEKFWLPFMKELMWLCLVPTIPIRPKALRLELVFCL